MGRPGSLEDVAAAIAALPAGRTRFVGIDGLGGAGKSALADRLAVRFAAAVVRVDDLQGDGIAEWDWDRLSREVVMPLLAGRTARYAVRCWGESEPRGHLTVGAGSLVIVEGVSATRREADVPWDLTVWVETPEAVRRERTLRRDGPARADVWREQWIPSEEAYVAREHPAERADLVVPGTSP